MGLSVTLQGFDELIQKLQGLPQEVLEEVDGETKDAADLWVELASTAAPFDTGNLAANITNRQVSFLNYEITSAADYSPYHEFGTITRVKVPPELIEYASQFKGSGKLKTGGIAPHPFFFVQSDKVQEFWIDRLKKILETEH